MPINQWFDHYSLEDPGQRTELQVEGLDETSAMIRELIDAEAKCLGTVCGGEGYQRVVLSGLGQGCAAGIVAVLGVSSPVGWEGLWA